jgi:hypothetical protein
MNSNLQYRKYMIHNGATIIDLNTNKNQHVYGNGKHKHITNKYLYKSNSDFTKPYGYENSDLKNNFLASHSYQSKLFAPFINK